jgi:hypothetical protein
VVNLALGGLRSCHQDVEDRLCSGIETRRAWVLEMLVTPPSNTIASNVAQAAASVRTGFGIGVSSRLPSITMLLAYQSWPTWWPIGEGEAGRIVHGNSAGAAPSAERSSLERWKVAA